MFFSSSEDALFIPGKITCPPTIVPYPPVKSKSQLGIFSITLIVLLDLVGTTTLPESGQLLEVARAVERLKAKVKWGTCAIVASRDALFGMIRMFEVFVEGMFVRTRVFRERKDAKRWLADPQSPVA